MVISLIRMHLHVVEQAALVVKALSAYGTHHHGRVTVVNFSVIFHLTFSKEELVAYIAGVLSSQMFTHMIGQTTVTVEYLLANSTLVFYCGPFRLVCLFSSYQMDLF